MAVETADINDGAILSNTRQNTKGDNVQFVYELPSGRKVTSEWIGPENKKRALMNWLETIRPMIVDDATQLQAEKRRQAAAARPQTQAPAPPDAVPTAPDVVVQPTDPAEYAAQQRDYWAQAVEKLNVELSRVQEAFIDAGRRRDQWNSIYNGLTAKGSAE